MKIIKWKDHFNWGGLGIGILGVVFVVRKLIEYSNQINISALTGLSLFFLFGLLLTYCFANILLALAWHDLLQFLKVETTKKWAIQTYGIAQIGKYVPGNIFHFASRQAIGQAAGLPTLPFAKSVVWEIGLIAATGTLFAVLIIPLFWVQITYQIALVLFIILLFCSVLCANHWIGPKAGSALKLYALFLIISGIIFNGVLIVATSVQPEFSFVFIGIIGVYVVAWLAGLITPGAPAGIGVRELVFLALLHSVISEGELLKAIILGRFVTIGGDVLFYIFSIVLRFNKKREEYLK